MTPSAAGAHLQRLWLTDFRSYATAEVELPPGVTVVVGANGQGKTNLLEAMGYVGTLQSFRGATPDVLVRSGAARAVVRAEATNAGRALLIECEIAPGGRGRVQVNKQRAHRAHELAGLVPLTVFTPEDLALVKGGPAERRRYLDDVLVQLHQRNAAIRADVDRVLRQRNTLLRQAGGRLTAEIATTLDVWDAKLAEHGTALAEARVALVEQLAPVVSESYSLLGGGDAVVELGYDAPWMSEGLLAALAERRTDELRRAVTLVGPHRDELVVRLNGLPARTHSSQGEQRTLALGLRLGAHRLLHERLGIAPLLLLDDVFSELDADRADALLAHLPTGQTVLSTAAAVPRGTRPDLVVDVSRSVLTPRSPVAGEV